MIYFIRILEYRAFFAGSTSITNRTNFFASSSKSPTKTCSVESILCKQSKLPPSEASRIFKEPSEWVSVLFL